MTLTLEALPGAAGLPFIVGVSAERPQDALVAEVLASAWGRGPRRLLRCVEERTGEGWEGLVSYDYHDLSDEDGIPPDQVRFHYMGETRLLGEAVFRALVTGLARFHLEAARERGVDGPDEAALRAFLRTPTE